MDDRLVQIRDALVKLDEARVLTMVREALADGVSSLAVVRTGEEGLRGVGVKYERQEYFLSALIMAGEIFRRMLELTEPGLQEELAGTASGTVLLGTVQGDIHDLGKNVAALVLRAFGFAVEDLGVNVAPIRFVERARELEPDVVGLSGLVSAAYAPMLETIQLVRALSDECGHRMLTIIGGGTLDEEVARYVGADFWTTDAMDGVRILQRHLAGGRPD